MKILIVDDHASNRKVLRVTLEAEGLGVVEAGDGVEALSVLDREKVDAIISDVLMPRMDGYRFCNEVRQNARHQGLPFIFYTNTYNTPSDEKLGLEVGADRFLRKPATTEAIMRALTEIARQVRRPAGATAPRLDTELLKQYNETLVAKLEEKNLDLERRTEELEKAQGQLREFLAKSPVVIYTLRLEGEAAILTWISENISLVTGHDVETVMRPNWWFEHLHPEDRDRVWTEIQTVYERGDLTDEYRIRHKDGAYRWVLDDKRLIRDARGQPVEIYGSWTEITGRKRAEEALAQRARLAALGAEVGVALTRSGTLRNVLQPCAQAVVEHLDAAFARVWTLNPETQVLELQASAGMYTHLDGPHSRVPVGQFKIGRIARERKPHLTNSVVGDPRVGDQDWARKEGMVAFAGYPLLVEDRVVGVMALFARHALSDECLTALGSVADGITLGIERKRADRVLRESERRFSEMLENVNLIAMTLDKNGIVTFCNDYLLRLTGWNREEVIGHDWFSKFVPGTDMETEQVFFEAIEAGGMPHHRDNPIRTRSGEVRDIIWSNTMLRDTDGNFVGTASIGSDITERKRAEKRLATHHAVTQTLVESSTLAEAAKRILMIVCRDLQWDVGELWTVDQTTNRLRCVEVCHPPSTEFKEFVEVTRQTTFAAGEGMPGRVWQSGKSLWIEDIARETDLPRRAPAIRIGLRSGIAFPLTLRNDSLGVIAFFSARIRPPDEELLAMFAMVGSQIGQFIERGRIEEQFRQAQKMEAFGQLAGGVAHDFNNILAVIIGYSNLLMDDENLSAETKDQLKQVFSAGERAANLTRQLLTFSRKKEMELSPLDLNGVLGNLTKMLGRIIGEDVRLESYYASNLPPILADEGMLEQVVMNLAVNARDAMPHGGQLTLATESVTLGPGCSDRNPDARPGDFVQLSVRDTGCGMSPEILEHIFEPFFTTKDAGKGTGLGLATVYGIVKQHQGWLEVESQIGTGTVFKVRLPASSRPAVDTVQAVADSRGRAGGETILLVEDETGVRALSKIILQRVGYRVLEAGSGVEALEVWENAGAEVDLLLTDMVMPDGLTGRELARQLTARKPGLKVLFVSGYNMDPDGSAFRLREAASFLQKPYHPRKLLDAVRDCLDKAQV